jgi:hypothetical protein
LHLEKLASAKQSVNGALAASSVDTKQILMQRPRWAAGIIDSCAHLSTCPKQAGLVQLYW